MTTITARPAAGRPSPLKREDLPPSLWSYTVRFRHGQCDAAGIVYTPEFFNVCNHAIEEWFGKALGLDYYDLIGRQRIGLGYVTANATFFRPCVMGETVDVFIEVDHVGTRSYSLILQAFAEGDEAFRINFTTVTTCLDRHRPAPIPEALRSALTRYRDDSEAGRR